MRITRSWDLIVAEEFTSTEVTRFNMKSSLAVESDLSLFTQLWLVVGTISFLLLVLMAIGFAILWRKLQLSHFFSFECCIAGICNSVLCLIPGWSPDTVATDETTAEYSMTAIDTRCPEDDKSDQYFDAISDFSVHLESVA